jgi:hypothetical protein
MSDWLKKSKEEFHEYVLEFLWRQWSILGVAGHADYQDNRIIDPEALLLFSLNICRYEPRLFDEILDWLHTNGHFINVQRLQQIQKKYKFSCGPQLSAVAELLSKNTKYRLKWANLAKKHYLTPPEPLFFDKDDNALPYPEEKYLAPEFLAHGLKRGKIEFRHLSKSFYVQSPACLLLKLRAMFGITARCEILCLLACGDEIHPAQAARLTAYYQKTVQTTLLEMAQSGAILTRAAKKEKYYRLKPSVMDGLLKCNGHSAQWLNWPAVLKIVGSVWEALLAMSRQQFDVLLIVSEFKKVMLSSQEYINEAGLKELSSIDTYADEDYIEQLLSNLESLLNQQEKNPS